LATSFAFISSCSDEPVGSKQENAIQSISDLQVVDGIIQISNKSSLTNIAKAYQKDAQGQNEFNNAIKTLQKNGFKPLTPIFEANDSKRIETFVKDKIKRLEKLESDLGITSKTISSSTIKLEDEIIADPFYSTLLNENREIVVGDDIYKYTELGLYFCKKEDKQILYDFLNNMTPAERMTIITKNRTSTGIQYPNNELLEDVGSGISHFNKMLAPDPCDHNWAMDFCAGGSGPAPQVQQAVLNASNLGACAVETQGFFEHIFGASEDCNDYYNDNRRIQTSFWNQNFLVYASVGTSARFQKQESAVWGAITWWEKSYATKMELGVNYVTYKYNYNVPMYNQGYFNYSTTFFEYNGTKYNVNGQVIPTVPTGSGNFKFNTNSNQKVIDIWVLGANLQLDNGQVNSYIDQALNQLISQINAYDVKQELLAKKASGDLKANIIYAVPFGNSVKFITANAGWKANDEHVITQYFDFNFTFTYKNSYETTGDYLSGLNGATSYTEVKAEVYGAALHNNLWRGRRLIYNQ
jgi:hypothetical protein